MKTIWKYELVTTDKQVLALPTEAVILTVQMQHGKTNLWALVDTEAVGEESRTIAIYGTGHPMPDNVMRTYLGTYQLADTLVFHTFEEWEA